MLIEKKPTPCRYLFLNIDQKFNQFENSVEKTIHRIDHLNKTFELKMYFVKNLEFFTNLQDFITALTTSKSLWSTTRPDCQIINIAQDVVFWIKKLRLQGCTSGVCTEDNQTYRYITLRFSFETLTMC